MITDQDRATTPAEAVEWYLQDRADEVSDSTHRAHRHRLTRFVEFCEIEGIDAMSQLSGRHFSQYKIWRKEESDINNVTLNTQLSTLRVFIKWTGRVELVPKDMFEYITPPSMAPEEDVSTSILEDDRAADILRHHEKFNYATRNHAMLKLMWHSGARTGALRAIDLEDLNSDNMTISIKHRPTMDTPLKNAGSGERIITVNGETWDVLQDYINAHRIEKTDDYERRPLFTTHYGRISVQAIRRNIYAVTQPCDYGQPCPHDRDPESCEWHQDSHQNSKCPSSRSPHAVRKGVITWARLNDIPVEAISGRMDVSARVLKKHYDRRTKRQQAESRREYFKGM